MKISFFWHCDDIHRFVSVFIDYIVHVKEIIPRGYPLRDKCLLRSSKADCGNKFVDNDK